MQPSQDFQDEDRSNANGAEVLNKEELPPVTVEQDNERPYPATKLASEREILVESLDWHREGVFNKVRSLSDDQSRQRHVRSESTVIGLIVHLAMVEDAWIHERFCGNPQRPEFADADWDNDPDYEFRTAREWTLEAACTYYREAIARSREGIADASLDQISKGPGDPFSLRWVLIHQIEETARHLGHIDILCELTDGRVYR